MGIKKKLDKYSPFSIWELVLFVIVLIFCFFSFQHSDILHTGGSSFTLLDGNFMNFYEVNAERFEITNYLISSYILFGIWNLPLKLLGVMNGVTDYFSVGNVIFWYKLLPTLFYAASAVVIYKIGMSLGLKQKNSFAMSLFWATTPIAVFSQFIFGQYDIFTLFFTLLGFLFFLKKNYKLFILFFAISVTFKYFPIFLFIPLLLLSEKKVNKLILKGMLFLIPLFLEVVIYFHSFEFHRGVLGFGANQRMFGAGFTIDYGITISIFIILWALICTAAYWKDNISDKEFIRWAIYIPMATSSLIFSFVLFHPQWLIFATPFLAITTFLHKRRNFFAFLDIIAMFFFVGFTVSFFHGQVDESLWSLGVFKEQYNIVHALSMKEFFPPHDLNILFSVLAAYFVVNIIFKYPSKSEEDCLIEVELTKPTLNLFRMRFVLGIMIFLIPAIISFFSASYGVEILNVQKQEVTSTFTSVGELVGDISIGQVFEVDASEIKMINLKMGTFARGNSSSYKFELRNYEANNTGDILYSKTINSTDVVDNEYYKFILDGGIPVIPNDKYVFIITPINATEGNAITIYRTVENSQDDKVFSLLNGNKQEFKLDFTVFGEK